MDAKDSIGIVKETIRCCFMKGRCIDCPFYENPMNGRPGKCMGMSKAGSFLLSYLDDLEKELKNGKDEQRKD